MNPAKAAPQAPHDVWVDLAKVIASQLIVLHHLAFYGPMADIAWSLAPGLFEFLARHARMAVQVFLVVGGYLAVRQLAQGTVLRPTLHIARVLAARYLRLVLPYAAMLVLAIVAASIARQWMTHPSIGEPPTLMQLLMHLLLLQDLAGVPALSAGVWYVAIDFQLYVLIALLLWLGRSSPWPWLAPVAVAGLAAASLLVFNRIAELDVWALYFMGAYGLGALAAWWPISGRWKLLTGVVGVCAVMALALAWRERVVVALVTAGALMLLKQPSSWQGVWARAIGLLARQSYALFLIHFPVLLVVNAFFTRWVPAQPWPQAAGLMCAWVLSMAAAWAFHRWIEAPSQRAVSGWLKR